MKIILLDLDNCISDDRWRRPMINLTTQDPDARYHAYHMRAIYDAHANTHLLNTQHGVVIVTGRPNRYRTITMKWLYKYEIAPQAVLMREDGDHRPAAVSKVELVQHYLLQTAHEVMLAWDDRQDIIDAYRKMGFEAGRVWIHDEEVPVGH